MTTSTQGDFQYSNRFPIPAKTWTTFPAPLQTNTNPGYVITGDGITALGYPGFWARVQVNIDVNYNASKSLSAIGASRLLIRNVNHGDIKGEHQFPVFSDPSQTSNDGKKTQTIEVSFFDTAAPSDFQIQFWHDGNTTFTGHVSGNVVVLPVVQQ